MEVALSAIKIGKRHRKDLGDIPALAASIEELGLLHAIVVDDDLRLVCGRRRVAACKHLGWESVPVRVVSLDKLLLAERDENTIRKDFLPSEAVAIGEALEVYERKKAKERQREHGGTAPGKEKNTSEKISEVFVGESRQKVSAAVGMSHPTYTKAKAVVEAAKADPEAFGDLPKLMDDSGKVSQAHAELKRREKSQELAAKAEAVEQASGGKPLPWTIHTGDVLAVLRQIENASARLIFADPPYNIGIDYGAGKKSDLRSDSEYLGWCREWLTLCVEKLTPDGSLWLMISDEYALYLGAMLDDLLQRRAWIKWYETFGVNCANNFNRTSRHIFYAVKDPDRFTFNVDAVTRPSDRQTKYGDSRAAPGGKILDDVWNVPRLVGTSAERMPDFPTQVPLEITRRIVGCASDPGDLVIDPFNGSGSTGVAAVELGRRYVGIELSPAYASAARKRLTATGEKDAA